MELGAHHDNKNRSELYIRGRSIALVGRLRHSNDYQDHTRAHIRIDQKTSSIEERIIELKYIEFYLWEDVATFCGISRR